MLGSAPGTMLYLTSYEEAKTILSSLYDMPNFLLHFSSGMLAETVSCVFWVPIDVVKERLQVQEAKTGYKNTRHAIKSILQNEGLGGIYRGYGATLMSFGPFSALYFLFYERLKLKAQDLSNAPSVAETPFYMILGSSATAGALASFFTNPLDLVKLRLQIQRRDAAINKNAVASYTGVADGFKKTIVNEGLGGLFKGAGARMAFHAPSTALTIALFERCKSIVSE